LSPFCASPNVLGRNTQMSRNLFERHVLILGAQLDVAEVVIGLRDAAGGLRDIAQLRSEARAHTIHQPGQEVFGQTIAGS